MTGEEFRLLIIKSGKDIKDVIKATKIPKATLYHLFGQKEIKVKYIDKLKAIGIVQESLIDNCAEIRLENKRLSNRVTELEGLLEQWREIAKLKTHK